MKGQRPDTVTVRNLFMLYEETNWKMLEKCGSWLEICPNFARVAPSLNENLCKVETFKFDELKENELTTLEALKTTLVNPPVLTRARGEGKFMVDTDACDKKLGRIFLQEQSDGTRKRIGYWEWYLNYT